MTGQRGNRRHLFTPSAGTEGPKSIKGDSKVEQNLVVHFDGDPVRFTPDGKISVLDAIGALTQSECPAYLWDDVKKKHPEIVGYCRSYSFQNGQPLPVVDNEGWNLLWMVLMDYLGESDFSCR
jgi:hypothetical protein